MQLNEEAPELPGLAQLQAKAKLVQLKELVAIAEEKDFEVQEPLGHELELQRPLKASLRPG